MLFLCLYIGSVVHHPCVFSVGWIVFASLVIVSQNGGYCLQFLVIDLDFLATTGAAYKVIHGFRGVIVGTIVGTLCRYV